MLTKVELICAGLLVAYGLDSVWWIIHSFIFNRRKMSIIDEIDKSDEEMDEEYQELFPPKKRRFTFTEMREKYRKKKVKALDDYSSVSLINALAWSEEDDKELRKELELSGYPKRLIKRLFDKSDIGALNKLIKIVDKRIKKKEIMKRDKDKAVIKYDRNNLVCVVSSNKEMELESILRATVALLKKRDNEKK